MRYDHLGMLPERAFNPVGKRMTLEGGGKGGDAPAAPDYTAAANATAQGNLEAAKYATAANRVNQVTPYGNLTYSQGSPTTGFDQTGYDNAMKQYQQQLSVYNAGGSQGGFVSVPGMINGGYYTNSTGSKGTAPIAPNRASFTNTSDSPQWTATTSLSPAQQQILDYQNQASIGLGQQGVNALDRVNQSLSQPFDYGSVQDTQDAAYKAMTDRLDPQWQQNTNSYENQLTNQGLRPGMEAYDNAMRTFNQGKNDAYQQANLGAIQTAPQTFQLANALRNQPLNELSALRTGSQVQNPSFSSVPQQATTAGPDLLGATNQNYTNQLGAYNANQANNSNFTSGLMGLAGTAATFFSDRRLKKNIQKIGTYMNGLNKYSFDYIWGSSCIGAMADEVEKLIPEAIILHPSGFKMVNYEMVK